MEKRFNLQESAPRELKAILREAEKMRGLSSRVRAKPWIVSLQFNSAAQMKKTNRTYLKKNYPTDILSFPEPEVFKRSGLLGDLLICRSVLTRQAREQKHDVRTELRVLLVHGVLHLLDFDHERGPSAARQMARFEAKLLAKLKVAKGLIARTRSGTQEK